MILITPNSSICIELYIFYKNSQDIAYGESYLDMNG